MKDRNKPQPQQASPAQPTTKLEPNPALELRLIVIETADGNVDVKYQAIKAGTEVVVPIRPAHLLGMLQAASSILAMTIYGEKKK